MKTPTPKRKSKPIPIPEIREAVIKQMQKKGLSIANVCEATGLAHNMVGQWIRGSQGIGLAKAEAIMAAIGLQVKPKR